MCSWHVVQEVIVKSKNEIVRVEDEIVTLTILFMLTPYMFMFCLCINPPVCCMYFTSLNINLATYFSVTCSRLSEASSRLDSRLSYSVRTSKIRGIHQESGTTYKLKPTPHTTLDLTSLSKF